VYFKTFKFVKVISFVEHSVARKTVNGRRKGGGGVVWNHAEYRLLTLTLLLRWLSRMTFYFSFFGTNDVISVWFDTQREDQTE
jgi:hypothetical protein